MAVDSDLVDQYISGAKSYEEFLSEYNNKDNYYPEDTKANMNNNKINNYGN